MEKRQSNRFDGKKTRIISARTSPELYDAAEGIFDRMGISVSQAIECFLEATIEAGRLPWPASGNVRKRMLDQGRKHFRRETQRRTDEFLSSVENLSFGAETFPVKWSRQAEWELSCIQNAVERYREKEERLHIRLDPALLRELVNRYTLSEDEVEMCIKDDFKQYRSLLRTHHVILTEENLFPTRVIYLQRYKVVIVYRYMQAQNISNDSFAYIFAVLKIFTNEEFEQIGGENILTTYQKPIKELERQLKSKKH